eukprot:TRINITY_DN5479_c0_g1_i1.p1 TRINITY_DN5479_c0_g1~~TRINITY_DN5479_c0_g1_i1.p1  ORF type:complete len:395 (-),score=57.56 TRINITY_DN5479_c0_g1_i1:277-1461(-)
MQLEAFEIAAGASPNAGSSGWLRGTTAASLLTASVVAALYTANSYGRSAPFSEPSNATYFNNNSSIYHPPPNYHPYTYPPTAAPPPASTDDYSAVVDFYAAEAGEWSCPPGFNFSYQYHSNFSRQLCVKYGSYDDGIKDMKVVAGASWNDREILLHHDCDNSVLLHVKRRDLIGDVAERMRRHAGWGAGVIGRIGTAIEQLGKGHAIEQSIHLCYSKAGNGAPIQDVLLTRDCHAAAGWSAVPRSRLSAVGFVYQLDSAYCESDAVYNDYIYYERADRQQFYNNDSHVIRPEDSDRLPSPPSPPPPSPPSPPHGGGHITWSNDSHSWHPYVNSSDEHSNHSTGNGTHSGMYGRNDSSGTAGSPFGRHGNNNSSGVAHKIHASFRGTSKFVSLDA